MKTNPFKHAMTFGLLLGIAFSFNFIISAANIAWLNMLSYLITLLILFLTYRFTCNYRNQEGEGALSYGQGLSYIILLYFFAALISSTVKYIYFQFIAPEYLENMFDQTMLIMEQMQMPVTDEMIDQTNKILKPATFALQYIWVNSLAGLLVGLVMAAFTKKEKSIFEEENS